jgi:hypothetical protein
MESFEDINKPDSLDISLTALKVLAESLPVVGSAVGAYWATFLGSPLEERRDAFFQHMHERILFLEEHRGIDMESLKANDVFMDALLQIIPMAVRTSQNEKHNAFRNALSNIAVQMSSDDTQTHIFIRLIDSLSVAHIKVLKFFDSPREWLQNHKLDPPYGGANTLRLLNVAFPDFENKDLFRVILEDLKNNDLIVNDFSIRTIMNATEVARRRSTWLGKEFLDFISFEEK